AREPPHPEEALRARLRASSDALWRRLEGWGGACPHASRRRAAHARVRALCELACAARLLSMRAGRAAEVGETKPTTGRVLGPGEEPTCGCRKVAPTRAPCFRPVLLQGAAQLERVRGLFLFLRRAPFLRWRLVHHPFELHAVGIGEIDRIIRA